MSSDPKGALLPDFLVKLFSHLVDEHASLISETHSLGKNVEHVKDVVRMQQSLARVGDVIEAVDLAECAEDAIKLNDIDIDRHEVEVIRRIDAVAAVVTNEHKLLQILVNLLRNAVQAVAEVTAREKKITMHLRQRNEGTVQIDVQDNGVGFAAENTSRLFSYGWTTKSDGHGFGLHAAATAAKELGGTLDAFSEGPGHGALFTLILPIRQDSLETDHEHERGILESADPDRR